MVSEVKFLPCISFQPLLMAIIYNIRKRILFNDKIKRLIHQTLSNIDAWFRYRDVGGRRQLIVIPVRVPHVEESSSS